MSGERTTEGEIIESHGEVTETLDRDPASPIGPGIAAPSLERGASLGRYIVLHPLGQGGMGQVYAAYDPDLDRRVAVKVLKLAAEAPEALAARLRSEGRALARLRHPNVVTVFDVGVADQRLFIATELVDGETVDRWLKAEPRHWKAVLDVFLDIAKGIAAAHDVGLVHRDIKPSNMMVAGDGRSLVLDFGIARDTERSEGGMVGVDSLGQPSLVGETQELTQAGAVVGTPAFMAPEQWSGSPVSPRADIYSFCLTLCYALYGSFPETLTADWPTDDRRRPIRPPDGEPAVGGVPAGLRRLVLSGLHQDPDHRPQSMTELLAQLRHFRSRHRRMAQRAVALILMTLVGAVVWLSLRSEVTPCASIGEQPLTIWHDKRSRNLGKAFAASESPFAGDVWKTVSGALDSYTRQWTDYAEGWCREAADGSLSTELYDLRTECLGRRLDELDTTVELLENDPASLIGGADMVDGLRSPAECADTRALRAPAPIPQDEEAQRRLRAVRQQQAEARALWLAGDLERSAEVAAATLEAADELGYWPSIAEAHLHVALVQDAKHDAKATESLIQATLAAAAGRHQQLAAEAFVRLVRVVGLHLQDFEQAADYARRAESALGGLGRPGDLTAQLWDYQGIVARQRGDYPAALEHLQRSLAWKVETYGEDHVSVARTLMGLGNVYDDLNDRGAAERHLHKALAIQLARLGPHHPTVAEIYARLGTLARESYDLAGALEYHQQAIAIQRDVHGEQSTAFAQSLTYLGELQALNGDRAAAQESFDRAVAIISSIHGPDHYYVGVIYANMATAWTGAGHDQEAVEPSRRALRIMRGLYGDDHDLVARLRFNLAGVHLWLGDYPQALEGFTQAGRIWRQALGPRHSNVAGALTGQGDALIRMGRAEEALRVLQQADSIDGDFTAEEARDAKGRADTAFALARALRLTGADQKRFLPFAERAKELYETVPKVSERELKELDEWLRQVAAQAR